MDSIRHPSSSQRFCKVNLLWTEVANTAAGSMQLAPCDAGKALLDLFQVRFLIAVLQLMHRDIANGPYAESGQLDDCPASGRYAQWRHRL